MGMDIGGTKTKIGIIDRQGEVLGFDSFSSLGEEPFPNFVKQLKRKFKKMCSGIEEDFQILGIGMGAPNANYYTGKMENPHNFDWGDLVPLGESVEKALGYKGLVTNDANLFALGEMEYGIAKGMKNFIVMTLGTGFGSGIVVDLSLIHI